MQKRLLDSWLFNYDQAEYHPQNFAPTQPQFINMFRALTGETHWPLLGINSSLISYSPVLVLKTINMFSAMSNAITLHTKWNLCCLYSLGHGYC